MVETRFGDLRGGWPEGRLQLSLFIKDFLADREDSWAQEIYSSYKTAAEQQPKRRGKGKRKTSSYHSFLVYMTILRRLGLIEYVPGPDSEAVSGLSIKTEETDAPWLEIDGRPPKRHYVRAVTGSLGDPAWNNPQKALRGY